MEPTFLSLPNVKLMRFARNVEPNYPAHCKLITEG